MKKTRLIISFLLTIIVFLGAGVACGPDDGSDGESIGKESNGKETEQVYNPDKESPYKTEDVTNENSMWDTEELFKTVSYDGDSHKWIFAKEEIEKQGDKYAVGLPEKTTAYVVETEYEYEGRTTRVSSPMYVVS